MEQVSLFDLDTPPAPMPVVEQYPTRPPLLLPDGTPEQASARLAEAVAAAWHRTHPAGRLAIPLGALAAAALISPPPAQGRAVTDHMAAWDTKTLVGFVRSQWTLFARHRPDLVNPAAPLLLAWCGDQPITDKEAAGATDVVRAALDAGLYALTAEGVRYDIDLFGHTLTLLKATGAQKGQAAFYTPPHVCDVMARIMGAHEGESFHDPALGTGGMMRAVAALMRDQGRDPATATWAGNDIDELAVACASVNAVLWGLGGRVLLAVADTLTEDWIPQAEAARAETIQAAQQAARMRRMVDAVRKLTEPVAKEVSEPAGGAR